MQCGAPLLRGGAIHSPTYRPRPGSLRLAVDGMAAQGEPGYIDIAAFADVATALAPHLTKGRLLAIRDRLHWRQ